MWEMSTTVKLLSWNNSPLRNTVKRKTFFLSERALFMQKPYGRRDIKKIHLKVPHKIEIVVYLTRLF